MQTLNNNYNIPLILRISIFLLLLFSFNVSSLIVYYLPISTFPDEILLWLFPCVSLIFYNLKLTISNISKNVILFLIIASLLYLTEKPFFRGGLYVSDFEYLIGFVKFFVIFFCISLIPNRKKVLFFILNTSQKIIIPLILFFYFDYFFGGNKLNSISLNEGRYVNALNYHINGLSFVAVYAMFSTIVLSALNKINYKSSLIRIVFFLGIIAINSSRGAFLMAILIILLFLSHSFSKMSKSLKPFVVIITPVFFFIGLYQSSFLSNDVAVVRRLVNNEGTGRESQAKANLINFLDSPYIGKGQSLGGVNDFLNTNGSNVHYTQALASYGVFLGFLYIFFMLNIFGPIKLKMNIINKMSLAIFLLAFISYNWTLILPLSFIAFFNKNSNKLL